MLVGAFPEPVAIKRGIAREVAGEKKASCQDAFATKCCKKARFDDRRHPSGPRMKEVLADDTGKKKILPQKLRVGGGTLSA